MTDADKTGFRRPRPSRNPACVEGAEVDDVVAQPHPGTGIAVGRRKHTKGQVGQRKIMSGEDVDPRGQVRVCHGAKVVHAGGFEVPGGVRFEGKMPNLQRDEFDLEAEKQEILRRYRGCCARQKTRKNGPNVKPFVPPLMWRSKRIRHVRRKSGEPYIYHPIAVARVVAEEMGLGTTSIVCALLHDTVEDTYMTLEDVEQMFGPKERAIVDGVDEDERRV